MNGDGGCDVWTLSPTELVIICPHNLGKLPPRAKRCTDAPFHRAIMQCGRLADFCRAHWEAWEEAKAQSTESGHLIKTEPVDT